VDATIRLDFLVQGRTNFQGRGCFVRHVKPGSGLGFKIHCADGGRRPPPDSIDDKISQFFSAPHQPEMKAPAIPWLLCVEIARKRTWLNIFTYGAL